MKKVIIKTLCAAMAVTLCAGAFSACGGGNAGADTSKFSEGKIIIGGTGPLTGGAAVYGQSVKNGIQLAINEINANGGVGEAGLTFDLRYEDDAHDATTAKNAYNQLMDRGIQAFIGTVTSDPCIAVQAEARKDNIFLLTPSGSAVDCIKGGNAFRVCFSDPNQGIGAAEYILENMPDVTKIGVIYNNATDYSAGIYDKFKQKIGDKKTIVAQTFGSDDETNFQTQVAAMKAANVDLLFLPIYYQAASKILLQMEAVEFTTTVFGCDGLDGLVSQLGEKSALAEDVMLLAPFAADATDAKTVAFVTAYKAAYNNEVPTQFAADAYDAVYILKAALEKANVESGLIGYGTLCDLLKSAMTEITVQGVTGTMEWTADGECAKSPMAVIIKDGEYTAIV